LQPSDTIPDPTGDLDPALAEFAQAYIRRIPDEYVAGLSDDVLFAEIRSVFDFMLVRPSGSISVRVHNPTKENDGYESGKSVVDIVIEDSQFLVDSVRAAIERAGHAVVLDAHAVMAVERDAEGRVVDVGHARTGEQRESVQHYVLDRLLDAGESAALQSDIESVLHDVQVAVRDFEPMRDRAIARMIELARAGEDRYGPKTVAEAVEFLEWLRDFNYVFLGYREYRVVDRTGEPHLVADAESGMGILSDAGGSKFVEPVPIADLPPDLQERYRSGFLLVVAKTNRASTVHRPARMDYVGIRMIGPDGEVVGESRMLGLFTSHALMTEPSSIPILRGKLEEVLEEEDLIEGSHDYRAVVRLFNSFPQADLWSMPVEAIRSAIEGLLLVESKEHVRLFVSPDLLSRSVSLMVVLPRDRFNPTLRRSLQSYFKSRYGGSSVDYQLSLGEDGTARIHFTVWVEGPVPEVPFDEMEQAVIEMSRTWDDRVAEYLDHLVSGVDDLVRRWSPRLPDYYKSSTSLAVAAGDIRRLDELASSDDMLTVGVQNDDMDAEGLTRIAVYTKNGKMELSDILPVLESCGLRIVEEVPTRVGGNDAGMFIHDVGVLGPDGAMLDIDRCGSRLVAAIEAGLRGDIESDSLDRLIILTRLDHEKVKILRAYRTYRRRVGSAFTDRYINDTLVAHPEIAELLIDLFERRFDPSRDDGTDDIEGEMLSRLDTVESLEEDRILRGFYELVKATVRTNAYRPNRESLSFKLRSADVPEIPEPKPLFETFVYAQNVEGIHLRGGRVARGGIRWSDRREDYRAEVLGLMKAQMTKNALIVPTGAKGGFVLRGTPGVEDVGSAMRAGYRTFIRGLLDVTDNLVGGEVIAPPRVRRHDPDDPYLVVAADRGTAQLSDTANEIAAEYDFWLRDAFASGGSKGYDHKALGITARGAWESVWRHFADMSIDADSHPITVVGIGDMSGDVFGNGMLLSTQLRLVAAFDHRDIFVDPDPDAAAGFSERTRLFQKVGSSWQDYDRSLISSGGGVWSRREKRIELSDEMRQVLSTDAAGLTPDELIRVILQAPVDLLWNGGVGTYVKAAAESHAACQDRSNDPVRVNGRELRCSVVAEGGNLGFTQAGRIEYARSGGRINADFIDNSGGVDCSDREVNLKILLGMAQESGELDDEERAGLVESATDEVTGRVVQDNYDQALTLSQDENSSASNIDAFEDLMKSLERHGLLRRDLEGLPASDEMAERAREGRGLTRPELAVLIAYAKQDLKKALLDSFAVDSLDSRPDLIAYFPEVVSDRFGHLIWDHPLRREILATVLAGRVINDQGITFVNRLVMETGATRSNVVTAHRTAHRLIGASQRWQAVEALEATVDPALRRRLLDAIDGLVESVTRWYLKGSRQIPDAAELDAQRDAFSELEAYFAESHPLGPSRDNAAEVIELTAAGIPEPLAIRHAYHDELVYGPDIIELAKTRKRSVSEVARLFLLIGERYHLDWLERQVRHLIASTRWDKWAVRSLQAELIELRRDLADSVLSVSDGRDVDTALEVYGEERFERHARLAQFMQMVAQDATSSLEQLMVAARQIRALAG
jgi:glutamate dehydrogenase